MSHDPVKRPSHYTFSDIEPIRAIRVWGLNYNRGCVVKYVIRAPHKGDELTDLRKARAYLDWEIRLLDPCGAATTTSSGERWVCDLESGHTGLHSSAGGAWNGLRNAGLDDAQTEGDPVAAKVEKLASDAGVTPAEFAAAMNEESGDRWLNHVVQGEFVCSKCNHIVVKRWLSAHEARCWEGK